MRTMIVAFVYLFLIVTVESRAADINNGKELHQEHCMRCHQPDIYTRQDRIVNNLEQLANRVRQCELANELTWFEEDVEDVIAYLNATYYQFGMK